MPSYIVALVSGISFMMFGLLALSILQLDHLLLKILLAFLTIAVSLNISMPAVSKYFRLVRSLNNTFTLEKRPITSLQLFSTHNPQTALLILRRDLENTALPRTLARVRPGTTITITTHLLKPKVTKNKGFRVALEPVNPTSFSVRQSYCCSSIARRLRSMLKRKESDKTDIAKRPWYKISFKALLPTDKPGPDESRVTN
jgi:hypothetical protein